MVAAKFEDETSQRRSGPASSKDSVLAAFFQTRAREVFGRNEKAQCLAEEDAFRLWLAWRGDPSYLIAHLSDRTGRESSWRVIRYTEIPELAMERDHLEARSLGHSFPEHVLAHFTRFVIQELDRMPGAESEVGEDQDERIIKLSRQAVQEEAFGRLRAGGVLTVRWPSKGAPGLFSRIAVLSRNSIQDSKYPALDRKADTRCGSDRGFTKFLERADKKHQQRWVRWATRG